MSKEFNEIELLKDQLNGYKFKEFLGHMDDRYRFYFEDRRDHKNIFNCFALLSSSIPPSVRLRYLKQSNLDESILNEVLSKYKELFGDLSDYEIIN